ncbi:MAG: nicotinate phosphoribosyltransferase [Verrucomicrobia bacterium]|nr:nicotinate phosphoribosyltransferase [Verrucomicrobiota bacterium]MBU1734206.1 nicotinate phosphoribosyltransferase [Verrucomicrobiota bacterium]
MNKAMLTDLYELTMMAAYVDNRKDDTATFDLSIRTLPEGWGYYIANGIEDVIDYLTGIRFYSRDIAFLKKSGLFKQSFLDFLERFRFAGEVHAVREGTPIFSNEPILRVTAKRTQAQLVESALLNMINFQTMIAAKASRVVNAAARGNAVVSEFGLRRAHEEDAGLKGARAAYIAGVTGTSNVKAGMEYGIPLAGTMAHSFVMSFSTELEAFRAYVRTFPDRPTLLIDTYDTLQGVKHAAIVARELAAAGGQLGGVRLDSGDLGALAKKVRTLLDDYGLAEVRIVASSDLNEYKIEALVKTNAPINIYGVGTELITAKPVAAIPGIYKLVEDSGGARMKLSPEKRSGPGKKQVFRRIGADGKYAKDIIALHNEPVSGVPLLTLAVKNGRRVRPKPTLKQIRDYSLGEVAKLPNKLKGIDVSLNYPLEMTPALKALINTLTKKGSH